MAERLVLAAAVLGPGATFLFLPSQTGVAPLMAGLTGVAGAFVFVKPFRRIAGRIKTLFSDGSPNRLLRVGAIEELGLDSLEDQEMRDCINELRDRAVLSQFDGGPVNGDAVLVRGLSYLMKLWGKPTTETLDRLELLELVAMTRLVRASTTEAGDLARFFRGPSFLLDIRDRVIEADAKRAMHDRQSRAYDATCKLWAAQQAVPGSRPKRLTALSEPDPDLWHRMIETCDGTRDLTLPLWCVLQPACDRATVALFLAKIARSGALLAAAEQGNRQFIIGVTAVIGAWNAGIYKQQEIGLKGKSAVTEDAAHFRAVLGKVAQMTGGRSTPEPVGLFVDYRGRAARQRPHWDLATGRLVKAPDQSDFWTPVTPMTLA